MFPLDLVEDSVSLRNDPFLLYSVDHIIEDIIMHVREPNAAGYSSQATGRHRWKQIGALDALTVPLGNLSISYPIESLLEEDPDD